MRRNKAYAAIGVVGLTLGFCAALLIGLYIQDELSYEQWLPNYNNIYRVSPLGFDGVRVAEAPSDLGLWLRQDYPQITEVTRLLNYGDVIKYGDNTIGEMFTWADANVFKVFQFKAVAGDLSTALDDPNSIVLTEEIAHKVFGSLNPIGQIITNGSGEAMKVTAVIEDLPSNTHLDIRVLAPSHAPYSIAAEQDRNPLHGYFGRKAWGSHTYIRLSDAVQPDDIETDLGNMLDRHLPLPGGQRNSDNYRLEIIPIAKIHLSFPAAQGKAVDLRGVYTVSAIGALILFAAIINYVNLMTARGMKRAPEIAVRKTIGVRRSDLISQFMIESCLYVGIAALLAMALTDVLLVPFNAFLQRTISFDLLNDRQLIIGIAVLVALTALLAGVYPSMVLSSYSPVEIFRTGKIGGMGSWTRHSLSIIQFAILTGLIIATAVIYRQARFGIRQALNQTSDQVLIVTTPCNQAMKNAWLKLSDVKGVACSLNIPQLGIGPYTAIHHKGEAGEGVVAHYTSVGVGFFDLYDLELAAGRSFDGGRAGDISPHNNVWTTPEAVVITESLASQLGFAQADEAIGELIDWVHLFKLPNVFTPPHDARIIGVVKNFQMGSVRTRASNAIFFSSEAQTLNMSIKISGQNIPATLKAIEDIYKDTFHGMYMKSEFFDASVENMYRHVTRQSTLLSVYAGVAIFVAALGLIGLAAFVAEKRTKEIGIRKVFGGNRVDIIKLLLWQFSKPVLLSNLIAWPVAYYYTTLWLEDFERHISLQWWMFAGAGIATFSVALLTVFFHAYVVSGVKPVLALRYE